MQQGRRNLRMAYPFTRRRAVALFLAFLTFGAFLLVRIFGMQVFGYARYSRMVEEQVRTASPLTAPRGKILARDGTVLACDKTVWRVYLSPVDVREEGERNGVDYATLIADGLSPLLGVDRDVIYSRAKKSGTLDQTVGRNVDTDVFRRVLAFIAENRLEKMVHADPSVVRFYPLGTFASHTIGFTGADQQGLFGLEYFYDEVLSGENGAFLHAKDATGRELDGVGVAYREPIPGNSIETTLDPYIESRLESLLEEIRKTFDVQNRVTGIVMNVKTGAILAMATSSPFDCNDPFTLDAISQEKLSASGYEKGGDEYAKLKSELLYTMWRNKATSELYEPGSTFKIVTAATALDLGVVTPADTFDCTGALQIGGYSISCHKRGGHGQGFSFAYGLQQSCNPTLMQVGARIGAERFYDYFVRFGYLEKTGIDLPSEVTGLFHKKEAIGTTELATASFGQRFKVSIIGQLTAVAAVANGGNLVTPYLVERIVDPDGKVVFAHETTVRRQVVSSDAAATVSAILEEGVSGTGGARNAYVKGYKVAAKTGTSQKFDILDANGNSFLRVGSCVAFAPSDDAEIAAIIVADEPQTAKYGAIVAAPYISSLLGSVLPYIEAKTDGKPTPEPVAADNFLSLTVNQARAVAKNAGLSVRVIGDGNEVVSQFPAPGVLLDPATGCVILYTENANKEIAVVPRVVGLSPVDANAAILSAGLNVGFFGIGDPLGHADATVSAQSVPPGEKVPAGSVVRITVLYPDEGD
ncbi:MAG: PASTA domain-containing protein [Clostridia bacterium]|nr:PASTA domain-containing protein [Clostridia bacterium]